MPSTETPAHHPNCTSSLLRKVLFPLLTFGFIFWLPACQGINREFATRRLTQVERAERAWRQLESEPQGSRTSQRALVEYNNSVSELVRSLSMAGDPSQWQTLTIRAGKTSRTLTIDAPSASSGMLRTLSLKDFDSFQLARDVKITGFSQQVTREGLGVPVVLMQDDPSLANRAFHPPNGEFLAATAVLEFPQAQRGRAAEMRLRFYNPMAASEISVGHNSMALAENLTAPLQFSLTDSTHGDDGPDRSASSASGEDESQLFLPTLYDRTKIPVVFVHGLRSGPVIWKNAINSILADKDLRQRYQPICFVYPSGLPIPTSSARLRQLLTEMRNTLDPEHRHHGFNNIVLVGHSMGGLLARMQVIDSGRDFWNAFFTVGPKTIEQEIDVPTREMVRKSLLFQRLPKVETVVFITTPHRGSEIADLGIVQSVAKFILALPKTTRNRFAKLNELPEAVIHPALRSFNDWGNSGVENLSTKHPYFEALARRPISVPFHSIIGIGDATEPIDATDGVVPYRSAHLSGAASETLVPFPHGCVEREGTVGVLMKILKDQG